MANEYKHIAVYVGTKNRIDALKGRKSYDDVLVDICTYFETLGIKPTSHIASPVLVMKEQSNRVIEVMRGVEKKQNLAINSIYELLKNISLCAPNFEKGESITISANDENYVHVSEVKPLIDQYKGLKKLFEKSEAENKLLSDKVEELKRLKSTEDSVYLVDNNILFEIIENIDSLKKTSTFNNSVYEIDRHRFDALINRLTEELR